MIRCLNGWHLVPQRREPGGATRAMVNPHACWDDWWPRLNTRWPSAVKRQDVGFIRAKSLDHAPLPLWMATLSSSWANIASLDPGRGMSSCPQLHPSVEWSLSHLYFD